MCPALVRATGASHDLSGWTSPARAAAAGSVPHSQGRDPGWIAAGGRRSPGRLPTITTSGSVDHWITGSLPQDRWSDAQRGCGPVACSAPDHQPDSHSKPLSLGISSPCCVRSEELRKVGTPARGHTAGRWQCGSKATCQQASLIARPAGFPAGLHAPAS